MFKVVLNVNRKLLKVKYLNTLPVTFAELCRDAKALLPIGMLTSLMASDPCGDWVTIENDVDVENIYSLARLAEQKIIKLSADFEVNPLPVVHQKELTMSVDAAVAVSATNTAPP